jgi:cyclase
MDRDGTRDGYDLLLLEAARRATTVPIIASGGAGEPSDLAAALRPGRADAALAASIFHRSEYPIPVVKRRLAAAGIPMRIVEAA